MVPGELAPSLAARSSRPSIRQRTSRSSLLIGVALALLIRFRLDGRGQDALLAHLIERDILALDDVLVAAVRRADGVDALHRVDAIGVQATHVAHALVEGDPGRGV